MMKLVRYGPAGAEKPGLIDDNGGLRDLSAHVADIGGAALAPAELARLGALDAAALPAVDGEPRLGPPVAGVGKIVAVGLNYADHAAETGATIPTEPILFSIAISALNGPHDPIVMPLTGEKVDWEAELAFVIGTTAKNVAEADALDHVAGYCVGNDVSEREFQKNRGGDWMKGKSADSFFPLGPWLVTRDAVPEPENLRIWLDVNGEHMQDSSTNQMIFGVAHLVSYVSEFMSLQPGDVITTGTPPGVGAGRKPPRYLAPGDIVELGIEGLGAQRQEVVAPR